MELYMYTMVVCNTMNNKQHVQYITNKHFNTKFCGILPNILANSFSIKIRIVELKNNIANVTNI